MGDYFACNFVDYDKSTQKEKARCALRLSNLDSESPLISGYTDYVGTPFSLFGGKGTFLMVGASRPASLRFDEFTGCTWRSGVTAACEIPIPAKFGLDMSDDTRSTVAARFDVAKGLSLYVGAQSYMEEFRLGARPVITTGVALVYRW